MILDTLAAASRQRVVAAQTVVPLAEMMVKAQQRLEAPAASQRPSFYQALRQQGLSFLCEIKKASPSKGMIAEDFPYLEIAQEYAEAGAAAISVLTEPAYFLGSDQYLTEISQRVNVPLLRKDFTVDAYQIYEAKALGASAVLLICTLLTKAQLQDYLALCHRLQLDALVETHDAAEIVTALEAGATMIGVNNRNLQTFDVDFSNALRLRELIPPEIVYVAESGIRTAEEVACLRRAGVDAVLVGEALMRAADKKALLASWQEAGQ